MAFETRWLQNFKFGTLSASAALSDTVLSSAGFASLASNLTAAVYMPIALINPATNVFEIVWATAHTASATTITVVRGRESTTAQAWPSGTQWVAAPTLYDGLYPTTRSAIPSDLHVGARVLIGDEQIAAQKTMNQGIQTSVMANPAGVVGSTGALAVNQHTLQKVLYFNVTTDSGGFYTFNLPDGGFPARHIASFLSLENASLASWAKPVTLSTTQARFQFWDVVGGATVAATSKTVSGMILSIGA